MSKKQRLTKLQKKWLKALRSGRYRQTTSSLCELESGSYCCLGVAARVCGVPKSQLLDITDLSKKPCLLKVKERLRLRDSNGLLLHGHGPKATYQSLTNVNDYERLTFDEIADFIEKDPENVFLPPKKRAKTV